MNPVDRKKMVQDWLDHPAWGLLREEIYTELDSMTQRLIDTGDEKLRMEIKARQSFLNKIEKYS